MAMRMSARMGATYQTAQQARGPRIVSSLIVGPCILRFPLWNFQRLPVPSVPRPHAGRLTRTKLLAPHRDRPTARLDRRVRDAHHGHVVGRVRIDGDEEGVRMGNMDRVEVPGELRVPEHLPWVATERARLGVGPLLIGHGAVT